MRNNGCNARTVEEFAWNTRNFLLGMWGGGLFYPQCITGQAHAEATGQKEDMLQDRCTEGNIGLTKLVTMLSIGS